MPVFAFMAGQETTSNQLSFTLYEILKHPDIENRYEEITLSAHDFHAIVGNTNVLLVYEQSDSLRYCTL